MPTTHSRVLPITALTHDWQNPFPVFQLPGKDTVFLISKLDLIQYFVPHCYFSKLTFWAYFTHFLILLVLGNFLCLSTGARVFFKPPCLYTIIGNHFFTVFNPPSTPSCPNKALIITLEFHFWSPLLPLRGNFMLMDVVLYILSNRNFKNLSKTKLKTLQSLDLVYEGDSKISRPKFN